MGRRYSRRKLAWRAGFQQSKRMKDTAFDLNSEHDAKHRLRRLHNSIWLSVNIGISVYTAQVL
jgi:hypothetical protein